MLEQRLYPGRLAAKPNVSVRTDKVQRRASRSVTSMQDMFWVERYYPIPIQILCWLVPACNQGTAIIGSSLVCSWYSAKAVKLLTNIGRGWLYRLTAMPVLSKQVEEDTLLRMLLYNSLVELYSKTWSLWQGKVAIYHFWISWGSSLDPLFCKILKCS